MPKKSKKPKSTSKKPKKSKKTTKSKKQTKSVIPARVGARSRANITEVVAPSGARGGVGAYKKRRSPEELRAEREKQARETLGIQQTQRVDLTGKAPMGRRQPTQSRVPQVVGGYTGLTEGYGITQSSSSKIEQKLNERIKQSEERILNQIKQQNRSVDNDDSKTDKPRTAQSLVEGFLEQQRTEQIEQQQRREQAQREQTLRESQARARAKNRHYKNQYLPTFQTDEQLKRDNEIIRERRQKALREAEKEEEKLLDEINIQQQRRAEVLQERVSRLNESQKRRQRQTTLQESKERGRKLFLEEQKRLQQQNEKEIQQREIQKQQKELEKQQRARIKRTQEIEKEQRIKQQKAEDERRLQQLKDDEDDQLFFDPITDKDIRRRIEQTLKEEDVRPAEPVKVDEVRPVEPAQIRTPLEQALETQGEIEKITEQLRVAIDEEEDDADDENFVDFQEIEDETTPLPRTQSPIPQPQQQAPPPPKPDPPQLPPRDQPPQLPPRKQSLSKSTSTSTETSTRTQQTQLDPQAYVEIRKLRSMIQPKPDEPDKTDQPDAPAQMPDKAFSIATEKAQQEEKRRKDLERQQRIKERERVAMGRERSKRDRNRRHQLQESVNTAESFLDNIISRSVLKSEVAQSGSIRKSGQGRKVADVETESRKFFQRTGTPPPADLIDAFKEKASLQQRKNEITNLLLGFGVNGNYIPFNARDFNKITNRANDRSLLNQLNSLLERDRRDFVRDNAREIMDLSNELVDLKDRIKMNQNKIQKIQKRS